MNKRCPECNIEVVGRSDKKFCSAKCKSIHQYENVQKQDFFYLMVDKQLKKNRRLLKKYNKSGYTTVRSNELLNDGFNPKYFTHYWKTKKGELYLFCYDFGYLSININRVQKYLIVQWQDYMNN
ncbi:hypothetical protein DFQ03_1013 [Maribacter caenipelagi]|uniref:DUF2116 family Zn-ribbon domain-containing protein n=1 Tax=Maribacter caenipelagi TaxID=1447781 RepID=A0A4R7D809_9FLAO|nr:hypothetical protein [Maribacter caenipelagi]TDS16532.1 hypothetical protein DFQ03_1013 [Maribacter caenipelagi]